jgi:hypothetical protein
MIQLSNFLRAGENRGMPEPARARPENFPTELSTGRHDAVQHAAARETGATRGAGAGAGV